jgi:hypothetical protein
MEAKQLMDEITNYDVVTFTNISDTLFAGIYGGKETVFTPHSVTQLPRFLANHYAGQLAVKILMGQQKDWGNDSSERTRVIGEILGTKAATVVSDKVNEKVEAVVKEFEDLEEVKETDEVKAGVLCPDCGKLFKTEPAMKAHVTRTHKAQQTN